MSLHLTEIINGEVMVDLSAIVPIYEMEMNSNE